MIEFVTMEQSEELDTFIQQQANSHFNLMTLPKRWCFVYGHRNNNALEQAQFKNVAKPMFSGGKRTGFS